MACKLLSVLILIVVLYEINSQAFNPNCRFEIQQLQFQINQAVQNSRLEVNSARSAIQHQASLTRFNIESKIIALRNKFQQAAGSKAGLCRNQAEAALGQLNLVLGVCFKNVETIQLSFQVSQINALKSGTNQICAICGGDNECVNGKIEEVRSQINGIQAEITATAADIANGSAECFQNVQSTQFGIINNVEKKFDDCL